jgi:hypothetical protein
MSGTWNFSISEAWKVMEQDGNGTENSLLLMLSNTKTHDKMTHYYRVVFCQLAVIFFYPVWTWFFSTSPFSHSYFLEEKISQNETIWRTACTAMAVPMLMEYCLDAVLTKLNPILHESHTLEDPIGHGLILSSLLFTSYIPVLPLSHENLFIRDMYILVAQSVTICGVFGKLHSFSSDIWTEQSSLVTLSIFNLAQFLFLISINLTHYQSSFAIDFVFWGKMCLFTSFSYFLMDSNKFIRLFDQNHYEGSHHFFVTKRFVCSLLDFGLCFYFGSICYLQFHERELSLEIRHNSYIQTLIVQMMAVIILTVLPGRVIRRAITAIEFGVKIQVCFDCLFTFHLCVIINFFFCREKSN